MGTTRMWSIAMIGSQTEPLKPLQTKRAKPSSQLASNLVEQALPPGVRVNSDRGTLMVSHLSPVSYEPVACQGVQRARGTASSEK